MRANPEIAVCGSALSLHNAPDEFWFVPEKHESICAKLLFESCLYHPTILYRKELILLSGGYDAAMPPAEDYDLWARLFTQTAVCFANLPEVFLQYRIYQKDAGYKKYQQDKANQVRKKLLRHIGLTPSDEEFSAHLALSLYRQDISCAEILACGRWLGKLRKAALGAERPYDAKALNSEFEFRWAMLCRHNMAASAFGILYLCSRFASLEYIAGFVKNAIKKILISITRKSK